MSWGSRLAALPPAAPGQESAGGHRWAQVGEGDRKPRGAGGTHPLRVSGAQVGERSCEHSLPGQGGRRLQSNHADVSSLSRYRHRTRGSRQRSTLPRYLHTSILRQEDLLDRNNPRHPSSSESVGVSEKPDCQKEKGQKKCRKFSHRACNSY